MDRLFLILQVLLLTYSILGHRISIKFDLFFGETADSRGLTV